MSEATPLRRSTRSSGQSEVNTTIELTADRSRSTKSLNESLVRSTRSKSGSRKLETVSDQNSKFESSISIDKQQNDTTSGDMTASSSKFKKSGLVNKNLTVSTTPTIHNTRLAKEVLTPLQSIKRSAKKVSTPQSFVARSPATPQVSVSRLSRSRKLSPTTDLTQSKITTSSERTDASPALPETRRSSSRMRRMSGSLNIGETSASSPEKMDCRSRSLRKRSRYSDGMESSPAKKPHKISASSPCRKDAATFNVDSPKTDLAPRKLELESPRNIAKLKSPQKTATPLKDTKKIPKDLSPVKDKKSLEKVPTPKKVDTKSPKKSSTRSPQKSPTLQIKIDTNSPQKSETLVKMESKSPKIETTPSKLNSISQDSPRLRSPARLQVLSPSGQSYEESSPHKVSPRKRISKKDRRRSSFAAGRVRLEQGGAFGGDLHKSINADLSNEDRLVMLQKSCLQYVLEKMEEEMNDIEDYQDYKEQITQNVHKLIEVMQNNGEIKSAANKERYLPNPGNLELDIAISEVQRMIGGYETEIKSWDNILADLEQETEANDGKEKVVLQSEMSAEVKTLTSRLMPRGLDFPTMLEDLSQGMKSTELIIHDFANKVKQLEKVSQVTESIIKEEIPKLQEDTFKGVICKSPKSLLEKASYVEN